MQHTTLNQAQQEAATTLEGPLLILAGAGAGKTKTLTHRIGNLVHSGVAPEHILAVTFTNKAAREMRERVGALVREQGFGEEEGLPTVSTFHALGVSILRAHASHFGLTRHFAIYDRADSVRAVKHALQEASLDPKQFAPRTVLGSISRAKGDGMSQAQFAEAAGNDFWKRLVSDVWGRYAQALKDAKALDFDDLLVKTYELLRDQEDVRRHYQDRWHYVHVDEYQDTNVVQYEITKLLVGERENLCCVGDIDQNIYAWRGATIDNILQFEETYPRARVILLEQNYRSTKTILTVANDVIEKNVRRKKKTLFTENEDGQKVRLFVAHDESDEAAHVARSARELIEAGTDPAQIAILYRANFQSRALEEACLSADLPYQVLGTKFFERAEVKDVLTFIRAALARTPGDIARVVNVPPRGIGKVTLLKMLAGEEERMTPAMRGKVAAFYDLLDRIKARAESAGPSEVVRFVIEESRLAAHLGKGSEEDAERLENVKELATLATKYDALPREEGIAKLLDDAALSGEQDELKEERPALRLMTVHASKGLEFDHVFITGLEEGLFPHEKIGEERDEEEERRLFYVALTRAKVGLHLSWASARTIFGSRQVNLPSEFVSDIDEAHLEQVGVERDRAADRSEALRVIFLD
ncbi:UvrD-helicase domain-containing protein [Patescibacteria group bacterium]|jgi:DNA helicase-2/ATP-dependent DNA helicase PcrA|nr:UvrD-helicase domain-containing protein [Patescibacteria group bacterium]